MVLGAERLRERFNAVPQIVRDELANELEKQAIKIVADMKRLVPRDTDALFNSIGWTWGDKAPKGSIKIGRVQGRGFAAMSITIYAGTRDKSLGSADAFYARFQEFGTFKMAANPFFYPAWRANRTASKAAIKRAVNRAVKRA